MDFDLESALRGAHDMPRHPPSTRFTWEPGEIFQDDLHSFTTPEEDTEEDADGYPNRTARASKQRTYLHCRLVMNMLPD